MYNATLVDSTAAENAYEKAGRLVLDLENKGLNLALTEQELTGLDLIDRHWIINNWEAIQPLLAKEREQARFREIRWKIREAVWEGLISDWLAKNAKCQKGYEADTVLHWVRECLRNDQREKLIEFLADVDTGGLEFAEKKQRKRDSINWKAAYTVILVGIGRIVLAYGVLAAATSKFEIICYAMLILIYCSFVGVDSWNSSSYADFAARVFREFKSVHLRLIRDESMLERNLRLDGEEAVRKAKSQAEIGLLLKSVFLAVVWLYAMLRLVVAVFF